MSTLRIYDTKGNAYSPDGTATGTKEEIKDLFYGGVRLGIRSDHRREISLFFRARETRNARTEQFYAVYSVDDSATPIQDFIAELTARIESEWGHTIDESSEEMRVYRELKHGNVTMPGDETEQEILSELIASREAVTVGVSDERNAIGLISEYLGQYDRAAIADSTDADILSTFDFVVTPGGHRGIKPLGSTEARWESTAKSLRDRQIKQEISSIRESVQELSGTHGLSNTEIRNRVQGSVPALKSPATDPNLGSTSSRSDDDGLISAEMGMYAAIGVVVLLVLFAAVSYGPALLGTIGLLDSPNGAESGATTPSTVSVSGELIDNTTDADPISENTSDITIELRAANGTILNETDQTTYNFSVNETSLENATLFATADGYQDQRINISAGGNQNIRLDPSMATVEGQVINETTGESISNAVVTLSGEGRNDTVEPSAGGVYTFENVSFGEYTLTVEADGYVTPHQREIDVNSAGTQQEDISLTPADSASSLSPILKTS